MGGRGDGPQARGGRRGRPARRPVPERARRGAAALLAGTAVWLAVDAARPETAPGTEVVVAARDVRVGEELGPAVLGTARVPDGLVPDGALTDPAAARGRAAAPLRRGEVVTDVRLSPAASLRGMPPGTVLAHVPVGDPEVVAAAPAGAVVDVLSTRDGRVVAGRVTVVVAREADAGSLGLSDGAPGLLVAVGREEAGRLAAATGSDPAGSGLTVVVHPSGPAGG